MATLSMRVSSEMRGRLGLFAPATSQDFGLACMLTSGSYFAFLIGCISYPLFLIPESTDLSTASSWRVAHSVMSHSDNSRQSCALSLRLCTSIRHE